MTSLETIKRFAMAIISAFAVAMALCVTVRIFLVMFGNWDPIAIIGGSVFLVFLGVAAVLIEEIMSIKPWR